jgi:hypothetical protein
MPRGQIIARNAAARLVPFYRDCGTSRRSRGARARSHCFRREGVPARLVSEQLGHVSVALRRTSTDTFSHKPIRRVPSVCPNCSFGRAANRWGKKQFNANPLGCARGRK